MFDFNTLKNNSIVLTGFEFVEHNPLGFFEFDEKTTQEHLFTNKQEGKQASGKLIFKNDGFVPTKDNRGHNKAKEDILVVSRAKSRPVLIFQNIEFSKQFHDNVFVIPIQTLKNLDEKIINHSEDVYDLYYLPKILPNGEVWHRVLRLSDARFVHISTLYGKAIENEITKKEIEEVGVRLSKMLNIEKLEKCNDCICNYENYIEDKENVIETSNI